MNRENLVWYTTTFAALLIVAATLVFDNNPNILGTTTVPTPTPDNSSTSNGNNDLDPEVFELVIIPRVNDIETLHTFKYRARIKNKVNGNIFEPDQAYLAWEIINGGGIIHDDGFFRAWDIPGQFENTILARYYNLHATSSVRVLPPPTPTTAPSTGTQVSTPTPTTTSTTPSPTPVASSIGNPQEIPQPTVQDSSASTPTPIHSNTVSPTPLTQVVKTPTPTFKLRPTLTPTPKLTLEQKQVIRREEYTQQTTIRKEAQVKSYSEILKCLQTSYNSEDFQRYFDPAGPKEDITTLGSKKTAALRCITKGIAPNITLDTLQCLEERLTPDRFEQYLKYADFPNKDDLQAARGCFTTPQKIYAETKENITTETTQARDICLEVKLGKDYLAKIKSGEIIPSDNEKITVRECFGISPPETQAPLVIQLPPDADDCLVEKLGETRYVEIYEGNKAPTADEVANTAMCFDITDDTTNTFLPAPAEKVPFIPTSPADTSIKSIETEKDDYDNNFVTLRGRTIPNSYVDIYIFSDPIIVTTQADANGDWSYTMTHHLDEGEHEAYSVVHHPEKGAVKSELIAFNVAYAADDNGEDLIPQVDVVNASSDNSRNLILAVGAGVITVALMIISFILLSHAHKHKPEDDEPVVANE